MGIEASRLARLRDFLQHDPDNLSLIADAADAAFEASSLDEAMQLLVRYKAIAPLPLPLVNLFGLVAMRSGDVDSAAEAFDSLLSAGVKEPSVRFNRAWVHALRQEHEAALALLDDDVVGVTERAAALKVQSLHHLGRIEEALAAGADMAQRFPGNDSLLGALSVAAMDADDYDLAGQYALQANGGADALTTRGLIALNEDDPAASLALFDRALAEHPDAPRAWLGKGLGLLATGHPDQASACLEKGAELFGDHLGSWIGAGWARFVGKDLVGARRIFERALALDENFAESHGALAVLDFAEGHSDSARRRADIALRLDKECFGGILARTMLLEADGNPALAAKIRERAMNLPIGPNGKTLAQAMIGLGAASARNGSPPA